VSRTYQVSDELHHRLEAAAARRREPLGAFVLEALEAAIARDPDAEPVTRRASSAPGAST
jgi:hypothetical protein